MHPIFLATTLSDRGNAKVAHHLLGTSKTRFSKGEAIANGLRQKQRVIEEPNALQHQEELQTKLYREVR